MIVINVASRSLVFSVDITWVTNRFETVKFDIKLIERASLEPVNHNSIHLEFIKMELYSYDNVLFKNPKLKCIQFIEVTKHVIKEHVLGVAYSLSIAVCSIHPRE